MHQHIHFSIYISVTTIDNIITSSNSYLFLTPNKVYSFINIFPLPVNHRL